MKRKKKKSQEEHIQYCLKEMFRIVGEVYPNPEFTKDPYWFRKRWWTENRQNKFKKWMVNYLRTEGKFLKKTANETTMWFLLQWGWTTRKPMSEIKVIKK